MDTEAITAGMATAKNEILAELHKDVFLTPKGMLKLVQLFVVICAFAMTTSASGTQPDYCFPSCEKVKGCIR